MKKIASVVALFVLAVAPSFAGQDAKGAFEKIKKLVGDWQGAAGPNGEPATKINYRLSAGGSVVVETLFPGEPHEMITMYHLDGENLILTHYCAAKNQPRMKLVPGKTPNVLVFDFVGGTNMKPSDTHMHSAVFRFIDDNHFISEWTSWAGGKPGMKVKFDHRRVK